MDEAFGVEVLGEEVDNVLVLLFVVELEFGVAEAFVQCHVGVGGVLRYNEGGNTASVQPFHGFGIGHAVGCTGENDAAERFATQRFVKINDALEAGVRSCADHGDIARLKMFFGLEYI